MNEEESERVRGWMDVPLDQTGLRDAVRLAMYFRDKKVDDIESSDLQRAYKTANMISLVTDVPIIPNFGLRPWNLGDLAGRPIKEALPIMKEHVANPNIPLPGGESWDDFIHRWGPELLRLMATSPRDDSSDVVAVTHIRNINSIRYIISKGKEPIPETDMVPPGGIMRLRLEADKQWHFEPIELVGAEGGAHAGSAITE